MKRVKYFIIIAIMFCMLAACQSTVQFSSDRPSEDKPAKPNTALTKDVKKKSKPDYTTNTKPIYPKAPVSKYSQQVIKVAETWIGTPYVYGGTTKKGVDCSGFVQNVYASVGVKLPRTSGEQYVFAIATKKPAVGDLVFFKKGERINHVAIYIGDNAIIHSSTGKGVIKQQLDGTSLAQRLVGYGKVY
jgi:cell wall-associated NlpC family hydrolase